MPIELAAVVGKMMAKEPERRFQEPKQVAQALMPFFKKGSPGSVGSKPEVSQAGSSERRQVGLYGSSAGDGHGKRGCPKRASGEAHRSRDQVGESD